MNRGKIKKIFAMAVISGTLMVGAKNTAYAVITDYAIKLDNQVYSYNKSQLEESFLNYKAGEDAKLYEDFHSKLGSSKGFYAFKDDKKGFVSYEAIEKGFLKSKDDKKSFDVEKFVENDKSESLEVKETKEVVVNDKGSLEVKENKQDTAKDSKMESNEQKGSPDSSSSSKGSSSRGSSSSSSSRSSSSRGGSSSAKGSKEVKKEEVAKKPEVVPNEEEKKPENPVVKPEIKKPEVIEKKENRVDELFPQIAEGKRGEIEKIQKPEAITSGKNIKLKSEITELAQKRYMPIYQVTTVFIKGIVENDGIIEVAGQNVEVKKGYDYSKVAEKICAKFKDNEEWQVGSKYVQSGYKHNLTFTSKKVRDHVDNLFVSGNGIEFVNVRNEDYGFKGIPENKEVCTVTVLNNSTQKQNLTVKVYGKFINKEFCTIPVEIEANDSKETIAKKIASELKKNVEINRYFNVENNEEKIVLTQKEADKSNLEVTVEGAIEKNPKIQDEREKADGGVDPQVSKELEKVKKQQDDDAERLRVQRENEEKQRTELQKQQEAAEREKEREAEVQNQEIQIESKCIEKGSTVEFGRAQTGNLAFKLQGKATDGLREDQEAKLTKDQTAKILDKTIEFKAGDDSSKIKSKILKAFEGHKDWVFEVGFVVIENHGASVKYTCNKIQDDVYGEKFAKDTEEIKFMQSNVTSGEVGKPEVKEKLEIAVKKLSNKKSTVNISIKIKGQENESGNVNVEIEAKDSVDQVAEKIATALKGNGEISRLYKIEVQKDKVILTQNRASKNETEITIK